MVGIRIDWALLEQAFESHAPGARSWLERSSGTIVTLAADASEGERSRVAGLGWAAVDPVPSREQYRMMERFIETVKHAPLKERLRDSIVGKGAFRRFKDAISRFPDERKRWFAFRDVLLHRHILEWLKREKIELMEMPAWTLDLPTTPNPEPTEAPSAAVVVPPELNERFELENVRSYLLAWARAHAEEHHYLFGPTAFERLAQDLVNEFTLIRRPSLSEPMGESPSALESAHDEVA